MQSKDWCSDLLVHACMKKSPGVDLPEIDSHLFFISRDYKGPNARALSVGGNNVPQQTAWDLSRAWQKVGKQLPSFLGLSAQEWDGKLKACVKRDVWSRRSFTTTKEVYTLRKDLDGLVCGQIDKNLHELWFCCPCLSATCVCTLLGAFSGTSGAGWDKENNKKTYRKVRQ